MSEDYMTTSAEDDIGVETLAKAGIACPSTGMPFSEIRTFGQWSWRAVRFPGFDLCIFNVETVVRRLPQDVCR
jgi:hypothetical protein